MSAPNEVINVYRSVPILSDRIYVVATLDMSLTVMGALAMVHYLPFHSSAFIIVAAINLYCITQYEELHFKLQSRYQMIFNIALTIV
jgi:hypothetical protein